MMAKTQPSTESTQDLSAPAKTYRIEGLKITDPMPICFEGQSFDLANLSADDATYLLGFPEQIPYLKSNQ